MSVKSFSIKKLDKENADMVEAIEGICIRNGINFSHVVLASLKKYKMEVLDGRPDLR